MLALPLVNVNAGGVFTVAIAVQANAQPLDAVAAFIDFDPTILQVVTVVPGATLPTVIHSSFDNQAGQVNFAAQQGLLDFPSKDTAAADLSQGSVAKHIAGGADDD